MKLVLFFNVIALICVFSSGVLADYDIGWGGDFLYRYEKSDDKKDNTAERVRHRMRARVRATAKVNENIEIVFRLATGGESLTSTSQTFGDYGRNKPIALDMAYFNYKWTENFKVLGGKMKNSLYRPGKSNLIFNNDWTPEGLVFNYKRSLDQLSFFVNGANIHLDERKNTKENSQLNALQLGLEVPILGNSLTFGHSLLDFTYLKGYEPISVSGNSVTAGSTPFFVNDYRLQEFFVVYSFKLMEKNTKLFVDRVQNIKVDNNQVGFLYGLKIGEEKRKDSWSFKLTYRDIQKDALVGAISDDTVTGGADGKGTEVDLKYVFEKNMTVGLAYYRAERSISMSDSDYEKIRLNYMLKF